MPSILLGSCAITAIYMNMILHEMEDYNYDNMALQAIDFFVLVMLTDMTGG